jgi:dTDP-4-amino-4,6-dideoxygalactose transaminase
MAQIPLLEPHLGGNERRYIEEALAANQPSVGPFVERFEDAFAEYVGSRCAVAVSSGTAALHLAMRILDVGPGDEVLAPTFSFVATVNPILYVGASPVLVDAERQTWGMDPSLVRRELERRDSAGETMPKAAVVAHLYGHPADVLEIAAVCGHYGVPLIEDASESLGARAMGFRVGRYGRVGCFSFNGNKIITTGQGGMLVMDSPSLAEKARHLRAQARLPGPGYVHDDIGFNYRMPNLAAAMGLAQMEQMPLFLARKREIADGYDMWLPGTGQPPRATWAKPSFWLYSMLARDREAVRKELAADGIESRPLWTPMHKMAPYQQYRKLGGTVAEILHAKGLSLPSSVVLTNEDQERVVKAVKKGLTRSAA